MFVTSRCWGAGLLTGTGHPKILSAEHTSESPFRREISTRDANGATLLEPKLVLRLTTANDVGWPAAATGPALPVPE
jgi:hypothetical protein